MNDDAKTKEELIRELAELRVQNAALLNRTPDEALRESQARFIALFEQSNDGITVVDMEGHYVMVNPAFCSMTGYSREELLKMRLHDLLPENVEPQLFNEVSVRKKDGRREAELRRKDGSSFFVSISASILEIGPRQFLQGIVQDITERMRAEEALRESKDQFRKVVENSPLSMALVNSDGVIEYINLKAIETFGYLPQDIPNMDRWWVQAYPDKAYRDEVIAQWMGLVGEALAQNHEIEQREYSVTCKDGSVKVMAIFGVWIADKVLVIFDDITERKRAEEELRENEYKYRLLFENAKDGIFIYAETGFVDCNQRGAEMYGLTREELIGRSPIELSPERQPNGRLSSDVAAEKMQVVLSGIPEVFEWQSLHSSGKPFDVEITLSRLELRDKVCVQAIVRDISERKRLEQEILKSQKLESIGTLAGGLAHDFNNLLQGVFGYIAMAKLTFGNREKSMAMLEQAEKALHQSVSLTTQLLTFSKGGKPVKETITLGPLIENSVKFALSGSNVSSELELAGDLWPVNADAGQIGQVIQNIVLNADQAMPEGGTIMIAAKNVTGPKKVHTQMLGEGNYVEISIRDTGIGIPPKYLQKIFDPYFSTKERGSGLGLATSYSIIKNHDGHISVTSELDKGTNFIIYLPATEAAKETLQKREAPPDVGKRKILFMDDEELVLNVAGEMIRSLGHDVEFARHGESAIEKYRAAMDSGNPFDIVILDLTIPGALGGRDTIERLREIDTGVRAIVSSGYSDDDAMADYKKYGFKARLTKPYKREVLRNTLNMLLSSSS